MAKEALSGFLDYALGRFRSFGLRSK